MREDLLRGLPDRSRNDSWMEVARSIDSLKLISPTGVPARSGMFGGAEPGFEERSIHRRGPEGRIPNTTGLESVIFHSSMRTSAPSESTQ